MRIEYDPSLDLLYVHLVEPVSYVRTETPAPGVHLDFDSEDRLVGIEVLDASGSQLARAGTEFSVSRSA